MLFIHLYLEASFRITNNNEEYSSITWLDTDNYTVPTETELMKEGLY